MDKIDQVTSDLNESKRQVTSLEAQKQKLTEQVASITANFGGENGDLFGEIPFLRLEAGHLAL